MFQNLSKQKSKPGALPPPPPQQAYIQNPLVSPGPVHQIPQQMATSTLPPRPVYGVPQGPAPPQQMQPFVAVMQLPPNTRLPMQIQNMPRMPGGGETVIISNFNEIFRNGGQLSIIPTTTVEAPPQQVYNIVGNRSFRSRLSLRAHGARNRPKVSKNLVRLPRPSKQPLKKALENRRRRRTNPKK